MKSLSPHNVFMVFLHHIALLKVSPFWLRPLWELRTRLIVTHHRFITETEMKWHYQNKTKHLQVPTKLWRLLLNPASFSGMLTI